MIAHGGLIIAVQAFFACVHTQKSLHGTSTAVQQEHGDEQTTLFRDVHEAFLVEIEARPRLWSLRPRPRPRPTHWQFKPRRPRPSELKSETRPRHTNSEVRPSRGIIAQPPEWGVKNEATSHIHIIPRTYVVLKRSGGRLELRLNHSGMFKHSFTYVMLKWLPTRPRPCYRGRDQGLRDWGQDQDIQSRGRGETEAFEISTEERPSWGTTAPREGLETEASRPRP